jgi:protease II
LVQEENFERNFILPQIEQEKRILSEIKEARHRRYDSVELKKHDQNFQHQRKILEL